MSTFTFLKGLADTLVGILLLTKPHLIYHSAAARFLSQHTGLRLPDPYPTRSETVSAQHAVAIMVIAVGIAHMRASRDRRAIPPLILMNACWAVLALGTVVLAPERATGALLMTGFNHCVFVGGMMVGDGVGVRAVLGV